MTKDKDNHALLIQLAKALGVEINHPETLIVSDNSRSLRTSDGSLDVRLRKGDHNTVEIKDRNTSFRFFPLNPGEGPQGAAYSFRITTVDVTQHYFVMKDGTLKYDPED